MLRVNPGSFAENSSVPPFRIAAIVDASYPRTDLTVTVTALPSHGTAFKEDGVTQVVLGQVLTAGELAALKFRRATAQADAVGSTIEPGLDGWFVLSVPQNGEARSVG